MAKALYLDDSYLKEFEAKVISVKDGKFVVLDQTLFYPNSGGQPYDTGTLVCGGKQYKVVFCGKFGGEISHEVDSSGLKEGDNVVGKIDWDRRYLLMRYHTAAHVISGMFMKNSDAKITGNQLGVDKSRIDFNLENFDRELLEQLIVKSNELISQDLPIRVYEMDREKVEAKPEMVKLAVGLPPGIKKLRIVEIDGFDAQPDGGTHVRSLSEIGKVELLELKNKGKNNRRLYFKLS